ncbi:MAG: aldose 1-epimerase family protein [Eubacteriales bacterium]
MIHTISNQALTVEINTKGAELWSIKSADNTQYLWQGDPAFWSGRAPILFPYIGRMTEGRYTYQGKEYEMSIHGFARNSDFVLLDRTESSITYGLRDYDRTIYPFPCEFEVSYALDGNQLTTRFTIENKGSDPLYCGIGGHTGYRVPLDEGLLFEDYYLEFETTNPPSHPKKFVLSPQCMMTENTVDFPLEEGTKIPLHHGLFDDDAIVLTEMPRKISLKSDKGSRGVTVSYPDMDYLAIWHNPLKESPFVCIEPWSSLPSRQDVVEDFESQKNLLKIEKSFQTEIIAEFY